MSDTKQPEEKLNPKQEMFCQLYSTDREFFGNGVQSYIESYNPNTSSPNWYKTACVSAAQLLSNIKVLNRINELMELRGLNDAFVDKQIEFLITQNSELGTKLSAIKEYNKLKSRIMERSEVLHKFEDLEDDELDREIKTRQNSLT